jgi:NAD(P)-dependent dehydrogenase (short-subunit alcohol dehydrogenase family)
VEALFDRVRAEHDGLDVLVNNAWGGYEAYDGATFTASFWEQPVTRWDSMFTAGVRATLVTSRFAAPVMIARRRQRRPGLIAATIAWAFDEYLGNLYYDAAKASIARIAFGMAEELRSHSIASVALAPGFMRTERVLAVHAKEPFDLGPTESPMYVARAVAALATDPDVMKYTGRILTAAELARVYGFTDVDGSQPEAFRLS